MKKRTKLILTTLLLVVTTTTSANPDPSKNPRNWSQRDATTITARSFTPQQPAAWSLAQQAYQLAGGNVAAIQAARNRADTAYSRSGSAISSANSAYNRANSAYSRANSAYSYAGSAYSRANDARNRAINVNSRVSRETLAAAAGATVPFYRGVAGYRANRVTCPQGWSRYWVRDSGVANTGTVYCRR